MGLQPRTFVLEHRPDGSVKEAFTPDFYLPEPDVYIELTVIRQPLVYGVPVEIMFRRDLLRLCRRWELHRLHDAALRKAA